MNKIKILTTLILMSTGLSAFSKYCNTELKLKLDLKNFSLNSKDKLVESSGRIHPFDDGLKTMAAYQSVKILIYDGKAGQNWSNLLNKDSIEVSLWDKSNANQLDQVTLVETFDPGLDLDNKRCATFHIDLMFFPKKGKFRRERYLNIASSIRSGVSQYAGGEISTKADTESNGVTFKDSETDLEFKFIKSMESKFVKKFVENNSKGIYLIPECLSSYFRSYTDYDREHFRKTIRITKFGGSYHPGSDEHLVTAAAPWGCSELGGVVFTSTPSLQ
jgi:hypothetical protein